MSGPDGLGRQLASTVRVLGAVSRNPALRRVELAFLLYNAAEFGTWVAILLYAYAVTGPASIGLVALAQLIPAAAIAPFAASLADRFPRSRVLAVGYVVQAAAFGATGAGMFVAAPPVVVYAAAAIAAAAIGITRPTQGALLPSLSRTPAELTAANGISGTVEGGGLLLGPLVAAAILTIGDPGHVLAAGALSCICAALLVARLPRGPVPSARQDDAGLTAGLAILVRRGETRLVASLLALRMVTSGAMDVLFVLLALDVFRTGQPGAAVLSAALGAGTVVGGAATFALVGRQRLAPAMAVSVLVIGVALAVVGTVGHAWIAPLLVAVAGVGYAATDVVGRTILQRVTPDEVLARVLGALEGMGLAALAVGSVLVPPIAAAIGAGYALVAVALILPIGLILAARGLARIDREVLVPVRAIVLIRADPVFAPLPAPQLEWVARRARWITVEPGGIVIREGDVGDAYYILESGRVRISIGGVERRITEGFGSGFGEIALLRDVPRTATVSAVDPSVLLVIDRPAFLEAVTGHEQARSMAEEVAEGRSSAR